MEEDKKIVVPDALKNRVGVYRVSSLRKDKSYKVENGTIYVMWNECFGEGIYKIGISANIERRMRFFAPSYIEPCVVKYTSREFPDKYGAETKLFEKINKYRIKKDREFFKIDMEELKEAIDEIECEYKVDNNKKDEYKCYMEKNNYPYFNRVSEEELKEKKDKIEKYGIWLERNGKKELVKIERDNYSKNRFMNTKKYKTALETGDWKYYDEK